MKKNGAFVVIFSRQRKRVLLVKRRDFPVWVLPGGGIETGESVKEAAIREVREETGFKVELSRKVTKYITADKKTVTLFEGRVIKGRARPSLESEEVCYFPLTNLPVSLFPAHKKRIEDALTRTKKPVSNRQKSYILEMIRLVLVSSEWRKIFLLFLKRRIDGYLRIFKKV